MGGTYTQAKHINMEKTRLARSGLRWQVRGWAPTLRLGGCGQPGTGTRWDPPRPRGGGQGETPAEKRGSGLAASAGRAAGGRGGGGGFLRISRAGGKPL